MLTGILSSLHRTTSLTPVIPTTSPPMIPSALISAFVSNLGPLVCTYVAPQSTSFMLYFAWMSCALTAARAAARDSRSSSGRSSPDLSSTA